MLSLHRQPFGDRRNEPRSEQGHRRWSRQSGTRRRDGARDRGWDVARTRGLGGCGNASASRSTIRNSGPGAGVGRCGHGGIGGARLAASNRSSKVSTSRLPLRQVVARGHPANAGETAGSPGLAGQCRIARASQKQAALLITLPNQGPGAWQRDGCVAGQRLPPICDIITPLWEFKEQAKRQAESVGDLLAARTVDRLGPTGDETEQRRRDAEPVRQPRLLPPLDRQHSGEIGGGEVARDGRGATCSHHASTV